MARIELVAIRLIEVDDEGDAANSYAWPGVRIARRPIQIFLLFMDCHENLFFPHESFAGEAAIGCSAGLGLTCNFTQHLRSRSTLFGRFSIR